MTKPSNIARLRRAALLATCSMGLMTPALAQEVPVPTEETVAEVIVVTANRREERLQDVSISVSAVTGSDIDRRNVTTLDALQSAIPALRLVDIGPGQQRIQLRGISQYLGLPTVGLYVDEFPINTYGAVGSAEVRLLDMTRVEVLRGPQPALYGEGSMGGTIRYVTANPDLMRYSGRGLVETSAARGGEAGYRIEGVINAPIMSDRLGLRIAASRENEGGWVDGAPGKNLNDRETTTARAKLLFKASDAFTIDASVNYNESEQLYKSYSNKTRGRTAQIVPSNAEQRYTLGTLNMSYDFGPVTLLSATGYLDQTSRSVDDSGPFYNKLFGAPLIRTAVTDSTNGLEKIHQEFRLSSNGEGPFRYIVGASYTDGKNNGLTRGDGESLGSGPPASALGLVFNQDTKQRSEILAAFGSLSYSFGDRYVIDIGGRYFKDRRSFNSVFELVSFGPPTRTNLKQSFDSFNPRVAFTVKTGESGIIYANAAKGFRSGGFNGVIGPGVPTDFGPETLWTYEFGTKQSLLGNVLFLEAAFYFNDYEKIQSTVIVPNTAFAAILGTGEASGSGFDLGLRARPSKDLSFSASVGYNRMRFDSTATDKIKGDPLDLVPDWNWSASVDYTPKLSDTLGLIFHGDIGFTDDATITLRQLPPVPGLNAIERSQARQIINLRAGITYNDIEAYVFANNVGDTYKVINPPFGAFFEPTYTKPRTIGFGLKGKF